MSPHNNGPDLNNPDHPLYLSSSSRKHSSSVQDSGAHPENLFSLPRDFFIVVVLQNIMASFSYTIAAKGKSMKRDTATNAADTESISQLH